MRRGGEWSECPLGLTGQFPHNTILARVAATNAPERMRTWSFKTYPPDRRDFYATQYEAIREWTVTATPDVPGLLITGPPGVGKTGLAVAALNVRAGCGDGDHGVWNVVTSPYYDKAVAAHTLRARPAPCHYTTWSALASLHATATRYGPPAWREDPMFCEEKVIGELRAQTDFLVLDEITRERMTPIKHRILAEWYEDLFVDKRLILISNHRLDSAEFVQGVGESMADRLSDRARFQHIDFPFPSALR